MARNEGFFGLRQSHGESPRPLPALKDEAEVGDVGSGDSRRLDSEEATFFAQVGPALTEGDIVKAVEEVPINGEIGTHI
eukprot:2780424-Rhodomonas_salina.1